MKRRDKHAQLTAKVTLTPIQNRPHRIRNVLALSDTSEPVEEDLGRSEPVSDDLLWWLSEEAIGDRTMVFAGDGVEEWLEYVDLRRFKEITEEDGQVWYARVRRNGKLDRARWRYRGWQLLGYSKDQYCLIRWALWAMDNGLAPGEAYLLIDPFWAVHKGQSPLGINQVASWISFRGNMANNGFQWP